MTEPDLRPPQLQKRRSAGGWPWLAGALVIALLAGAAWYTKDDWLSQDAAPETQLPATPSVSTATEPLVPDQPVQPVPELSTAVTEESAAPRYPLPGQDSSVQPQADALSLDQLALQWLGPQALKFLMTPGLAHHVVATIDNLPRGHAAPRLWPLSPVGGKIVLEEGPQSLLIAPANSARYDAVVHFLTGIAPAQAADWYRQAYPLLQSTYEGLGYPDKYFNDRVVEVIDHLLLTPEPVEPIAVDLVQVQGQIAPQQPWLRYEYADPQLQARSAGQKILLRLGAEHRSRLKAYLQALRAQITFPR